MASSVDGLISGMSTTQVISQLMQAEAMPQQQLKAKVQTEQSAQTALRTINTKFAALRTASHALRLDDPLQTPAWKAVKATASSDAVTATAGATATAGEVTFDVTHLARASVGTAVMPPSGPATAAGKVYVKIGTADPVELTVTNDTTQGVADAINFSGLAAKATVVTTDQGTVLQVAATKTGLANAVSLTSPGGGPANGGLVVPLVPAVTAVDAKIKVGSGDPVTGGYTVSSATNTFTGLVPGVTIVANKIENGVTVSMTADSGSVADKVQAMVDAANGALAEMSKQSSYDPASGRAAPLLSDSRIRQLQQEVLSAVSVGTADYGSFKKLGIETDRNGRLSFNRNTFLNEYQADPTATRNAVASGLAVALDKVATDASNSTDGSLTLAVQARESNIRDLNNRVSGWDVRLQSRRKALERQFTNLEVALGKLQDQSNWLSGQIASLG